MSVSTSGLILGRGRHKVWPAEAKSQRDRDFEANSRAMADWTFEQTRRDLRVSEAHLRALVAKRMVPHHRVGDLVRFQPDVLRAWKAAGGTDAHRPPAVVAVPRFSGARAATRPPAAAADMASGSSMSWRALLDDNVSPADTN